MPLSRLSAICSALPCLVILSPPLPSYFLRSRPLLSSPLLYFCFTLDCDLQLTPHTKSLLRGAEWRGTKLQDSPTSAGLTVMPPIWFRPRRASGLEGALSPTVAKRRDTKVQNTEDGGQLLCPLYATRVATTTERMLIRVELPYKETNGEGLRKGVGLFVDYGAEKRLV